MISAVYLLSDCSYVISKTCGLRIIKEKLGIFKAHKGKIPGNITSNGRLEGRDDCGGVPTSN